MAPDEERALRDAAAMTGQSVTGFILSAAIQHAQHVLSRENTITVSSDEFDAFVSALDEPVEFVPEMVALFRRGGQIPQQ